MTKKEGSTIWLVPLFLTKKEDDRTMYLVFVLSSYLISAFSSSTISEIIYLIASVIFAVIDVWDRKQPKTISHINQNIFPNFTSGEKSDNSF